MNPTVLRLPPRAAKPRRNGLTMVIDGGIGVAHFADLVSSAAEYIDFVKFGWGTAVVTAGLQAKIDVLAANDIGFYFGGTLFEKYVLQGRFDDYRKFCDAWSCRHVEVSNGTITLSNSEKASYIRKLTDDFTVISEVGYKDPGRSEQLPPRIWAEYIAEDLAAGASLVTLPLWSTTVVRRILGLPLSVQPCCAVPLGWPVGRYGPTTRKPVGDVVHLDRYGNRAWRTAET
jgi:phosphosulfolactate synthase